MSRHYRGMKKLIRGIRVEDMVDHPFISMDLRWTILWTNSWRFSAVLAWTHISGMLFTVYDTCASGMDALSFYFLEYGYCIRYSALLS
jgi:hypothetical protein